MGLRRGQSRSTQDDVNAIVTWAEKVKSGVSNVELGRRLGCTGDTVANRLAKCEKKLGLKIDYAEIVEDILVPKTLEAAEDLIDRREPSVVRQILATVLPEPGVRVNFETSTPDEVRDQIGEIFRRALRRREREEKTRDSKERAEKEVETEKPESEAGEGQGGATNRPDRVYNQSLASSPSQTSQSED